MVNKFGLSTFTFQPLYMVLQLLVHEQIYFTELNSSGYLILEAWCMSSCTGGVPSVLSSLGRGTAGHCLAGPNQSWPVVGRDFKRLASWGEGSWEVGQHWRLTVGVH